DRVGTRRRVPALRRSRRARHERCEDWHDHRFAESARAGDRRAGNGPHPVRARGAVAQEGRHARQRRSRQTMKTFASTPTFDDVNLILRLYEMRREERLRAARAWFIANFKPRTLQEFDALCPPGSDANASFRMVT